MPVGRRRTSRSGRERASLPPLMCSVQASRHYVIPTHAGGASPCSASDANANLSGDPPLRHTKRNVLPASELGLPWPRQVDT